MKANSPQPAKGVEEFLFQELDLTPSHLAKGSLGKFKQIARLTFVVGPRVLFTSRISKHCATLMTSLTVPAFFLTGLTILPRLLFTDPEQNTYYYFARAFHLDGMMLLVMMLMVACCLFALTLPAIEEPPALEVK